MSKFTPVEVTVVAGEKYFWCSCGLSAQDPFCDGSHKGSGKKSLLFEPEATGRVWLCTCKNTKRPPYCDGSHNHE